LPLQFPFERLLSVSLWLHDKVYGAPVSLTAVKRMVHSLDHIGNQEAQVRMRSRSST